MWGRRWWHGLVLLGRDHDLLHLLLLLGLAEILEEPLQIIHVIILVLPPEDDPSLSSWTNWEAPRSWSPGTWEGHWSETRSLRTWSLGEPGVSSSWVECGLSTSISWEKGSWGLSPREMSSRNSDMVWKK